MTARTQQKKDGAMITKVGMTVFYRKNLALDFMEKMRVKAYGKAVAFDIVTLREVTPEDPGVWEVEACFREEDEKAFELVKKLMADL